MSHDRYDSTRQAWENIWQEADVLVELEAVQSARSLETIALYEAHLPKDDLILEAGSGLSAVVMTLRQKGYSIMGIDYAINALYASKQYEPSLGLGGADVHHLPFANDTFGAYLSFGVLEHFEQGMLPALKEAHRILKPNAVIVLTIPYPNAIHQAVRLKRTLLGQPLLTDETFFESTYTRDDLIANVRMMGFEEVVVAPTSHAFTLWGLGFPFRAGGYYQTSPLADRLGDWAKNALPWWLNFMTLIVARKVV